MTKKKDLVNKCEAICLMMGGCLLSKVISYVFESYVLHNNYLFIMYICQDFRIFQKIWLIRPYLIIPRQIHIFLYAPFFKFTNVISKYLTDNHGWSKPALIPYKISIIVVYNVFVTDPMFPKIINKSYTKQRQYTSPKITPKTKIMAII